MTTTKLRKLQRLSRKNLLMWQDFWMEMGLSVHELSNDLITGWNLRFVLALASSKRQLVIDFWFNSRINFSMEVCVKIGWYVWIYDLWERFRQTLLRTITTLCQNQTTTSEALFTNAKTTNHSSHKQQEPKDFWNLCQLVDEVARWNDSKRRKVTSETVRSLFVELGMIDKDRCLGLDSRPQVWLLPRSRSTVSRPIQWMRTIVCPCRDSYRQP